MNTLWDVLLKHSREKKYANVQKKTYSGVIGQNVTSSDSLYFHFGAEFLYFSLKFFAPLISHLR